jgi:hypothetical protein
MEKRKHDRKALVMESEQKEKTLEKKSGLVTAQCGIVVVVNGKRQHDRKLEQATRG